MQPKRTKNSTVDDSDSDDDSGDSVATVKATARKSTSPVIRGKRRGRPPGSKRQRILDGSEDDETQPSTSGISNGVRRNDPQESSDFDDTDSGSESPDSDDMAVDDSREKQRTQKKRPASPARVSPRKHKATNYSLNQDKSQKGKKGPKQHSTSLQNGNSQNGTQSLSQLSRSLNIPKSSQGSKGKVFDPNHIETLAHKCVYFLLIEDQKKYAIRRKAIVQHVFKDENYSPKLYTAVILKASSILMKTFGMELMELENQKDSYLIINILKRELGVEEYVELSRTKHQQHGLILYLLTLIFMNGNCITEDELNKALKTLRIDLTSKKPHSIFGDVKKYITVELVKQMYLNYECISKDPPRFEITWGLRAKQEFDKKDLLSFACQILGDTTPESWILQYRDAEESASPL